MTERLIHYNPFRSVNKYLKLYLESKVQKEMIYATPQRAYGSIVQAYNDKTKKFSDWPVFSLAMIDKRIDKEQLNPVAFRMDGGLSMSTYVDGTDVVNVCWMPMTFSYQLDIWADTRNRMESYLNILIMILSNYRPYTIYYQENNLLSSVGIIVLEGMSETSDLEPGENIVQFRHTTTFNVITQIPIKANSIPQIFERVQTYTMMTMEGDFDPNDPSDHKITDTITCDDTGITIISIEP